MQCPKCQSKVSFREVADQRCPTCASKIYWVDEWRWLRGLSCGLLAILMISHWFPPLLSIPDGLHPSMLVFC